MSFSALANLSRRIPDGGRSSPRTQAVTGFGLHHNAGVDAYGQASAPGREVSANYWITNAGVILPNIDESRRAFTSGAAGYPAGAAADHRNITVEISNSPEGVREGTWAISPAAEAALVALIADVYRRHNLGPVTRSTNRGIGVHQDWVPTQCPGPHIMQHLGSYIQRAETLRTQSGAQSTTSPEEDEDMAKNSGFYFKRNGKSMNLIVNTDSGWYHEFESAEGGYNSGVARAFSTGDFEEISVSHADAMKRDCTAVRTGKP